MGVSYHVYWNAGSGPVVYGAPLATTPSLSFLTAVLAAPGDYTFAVRAFDTVSGLEELNTTARVRLLLDGAGLDATGRPSPPVLLTVLAGPAAGQLTVRWSHNPRLGGSPTAFKVWATAGGSVNYALPPAATLDLTSPTSGYTATSRDFAVVLTGLTGGTLYALGVRATNASGDEPNTVAGSGVPLAAGPDAVAGLTVTPTYQQ